MRVGERKQGGSSIPGHDRRVSRGRANTRRGDLAQKDATLAISRLGCRTPRARAPARPVLRTCFALFDIGVLSNRELLQVWAKSLQLLYERGVVRTYNSPIGDIAGDGRSALRRRPWVVRSSGVGCRGWRRAASGQGVQAGADEVANRLLSDSPPRWLRRGRPCRFRHGYAGRGGVARSSPRCQRAREVQLARQWLQDLAHFRCASSS